jgi:hypothetical protein
MTYEGDVDGAIHQLKYDGDGDLDVDAEGGEL